MTHKLNSTQTVAVATDVYWIPIDDQAPRGVKVQLLSLGGVASYGTLGTNRANNSFFTHWCPVPQRPRPVEGAV